MYIERRQRELAFEKSVCAHLVMLINVHLHVFRFNGFSAFVFLKGKFATRKQTQPATTKKEEKP